DAPRSAARGDPREDGRPDGIAIDLHRRREAGVDRRLAVGRGGDVADRLVASRKLVGGQDAHPRVVVGRVGPDDVDVAGGVVVRDGKAGGRALDRVAARDLAVRPGGAAVAGDGQVDLFALR